MANIIIPTQHITKTITGSGQSVSSKTITLNTKDTYVPENIEVTVDATVDVGAASLSNAASSGVNYSENNTNNTIIPANGSLYINEGWIGNTMISLGHMIPDDTGYDNAGVAHIRADYEAYDTEGNKLIGTMADTILSSSGGGMSGELSVTGGTINVTPSIIGTGVSSTYGQTYGVTSTQPSGTDGTAYLTFDPDATGGSVTNTASITVTRAAVNTSGVTGYYDGTIVSLASGDKTFSNNSVSTSTSIQNGSNWYMPIVTIEGTGGNVTRTGGSGTITGTRPNVSIEYSGKFTDVGTNRTYGVMEGVPSEGIDGIDYLKIETIATPDATESWSGTATINYHRSNVKSNAEYKGAVKTTTDTVFLSETTGSLTQTVTGSVSATASGTTTYSIPIVSVTHSGGEVTATASGSTGTRARATVSNNILGKTSTGNTITVGDYGFSAGDWSLSDMSGANAGKGYITIYPSYTGNSPTCVCKANAHVNAVTYSNNAGAVAAHSEETALAAQDATPSSDTVTLSSTQVVYGSGKRSWRIPIIEPRGTGGAVSVNATATITEVGENGSTAPTVSIDYSGYVADHASDYGIVYEQPNGFVDGDNYALLDVSDISTSGYIVGSFTGSYNRAAVVADNSYPLKGAVSMTSTTELLGAVTGQAITGTFTSSSISASVDGQKHFYIPISQHAISGGELSVSTNFDIVAPGTRTMTPDTLFKKGTGTNGTASNATLSDYGIVNSKPDGKWVLFDPVVSDGTNNSGQHSISLSGSVGVSRGSVTATATRGITTDATWMSSAVSQTFEGTGSWVYTLAEGDNKYIPVRTPIATVSSHDITNAQATGSETATFKRQGTIETLPTGIMVRNSNPSDFLTHSGGYIIIEPSISTTAGSSSAKGMANIEAGITTDHTGNNGVESIVSTQSVGVNVSNPENKCYIKVFDGSYSVSTTTS